MPASPEIAARLAKETAEVYADATATMLNKVARRLARGVDTPGWAEAKLLEVHRLREEARLVVDRLDVAGADAAAAAVNRAGDEGARRAVGDLKRLNVSGDLARVHPATVDALIRETVDKLQASHLRILRVAEDVYRGTVAQATAQVSTGAMTRREAAQRALDRFASQGVGGFVDDAGRSWALESYAEMAVRTSSGRAAIAGYTDTLLDNGVDLGYISTSPAPCELCDPWEGLVVTLSGSHPEYPSLSDAEDDGMFHPNCTHAVEGYLPGVSRTGRDDREDAETRRERDAERQEQRRLERGVREWKRREAVALDDDAAGYARGKVREWQTRAREHDAASPLTLRQRHREQIGSAR